MSQFLHKLSGELRGSLERWYLVSCLLFIVVFLSMALVTGFTVYNISQLPAPQAQFSAPQEYNEVNVQGQLDELSGLIKQQESLREILDHCMQIPDDIYLTKVIIELHQKIEFFGIAATVEDVHEFLRLLKAKQCFKLEQVTMKPAALQPQEQGVNFYIQAPLV